MIDRKATVTRTTSETDITVSIDLDGTGKSDITTEIGFFDHMLEGFARHGFFDLDIQAKGDLQVDCHHTVEDTGIVLGAALRQAMGDKSGIVRFGECILPMDEALVLCALDVSGRPYFVFDHSFSVERVGFFDTEMVREFFYAISYSAGINLHFQILNDGNAHHVIEAMFKAFAKSLDRAVTKDPRIHQVLSTKGTL